MEILNMWKVKCFSKKVFFPNPILLASPKANLMTWQTPKTYGDILYLMNICDAIRQNECEVAQIQFVASRIAVFRCLKCHI